MGSSNKRSVSKEKKRKSAVDTPMVAADGAPDAKKQRFFVGVSLPMVINQGHLPKQKKKASGSAPAPAPVPAPAVAPDAPPVSALAARKARQKVTKQRLEKVVIDQTAFTGNMASNDYAAAQAKKKVGRPPKKRMDLDLPAKQSNEDDEIDELADEYIDEVENDEAVVSNTATTTSNEPIHVILPKTTKAPISALAARRAKKQQAPEVVVVQEEIQEIQEQSVESIEIDMTNGNDIHFSPSDQADHTDHHVEEQQDTNDDPDTPAPSTPGDITPYGQSDIDTPPPPANRSSSQTSSKKSASKLLDLHSVSTYATHLAFTFTHDEEEYLCIGFHKGERLVFLGHALIAPLFGTIEVAGALLSSSLDKPASLKRPLDPWHLASFYPVFSSRTAALMTVESVPYQQSSIASPIDVNFENLRDRLKPLMLEWSTLESVILVKGLNWSGATKLEKNLPAIKDVFSVKSRDFLAENDAAFYEDIPGFQPILTPTPEVKSCQNPPSWEQAVDRLTENERGEPIASVSLICGTRNMGKSTFARYLVNRLLNGHRRVAYLETDLGQSEFTPNGMVALHILDSPILGPPFTHPHHRAKRAHFVGSNTPERNPDHYIVCVQQLLQAYREEAEQWALIAAQDGDESPYQLLPLVVNTPGWVKGLGYDLLVAMLQNVAPSHVFAFSAPSLPHVHHQQQDARQLPADFDDHVRAMNIPHLLYLQTGNVACFASNSSSSTKHAQISNATATTTWADRYQASDLRQLMLMSYFHHDPHAFCKLTHRAWWHPTTLVERVPWKVDWSHLQGIWILFNDVPSSQLLYALNGTLVALVGDLAASEDDDNVTPIPNPNNPINPETDEIDELVDDDDDDDDDDDEIHVPQPAQPAHPVPDRPDDNLLGELQLPAYHAGMSSSPPDPHTTTCIGLALIRSIDRDQRRFYLVTSVPLERLHKVKYIVKGDLELTLTMVLDHHALNPKGVAGVSWRNVPYVSLDIMDSVGAGTARARRNIMRRSQQH
ncbi:hypothetical protein BC940DRAFT_98671 [Gongronella butleri]|nr:hypothetical protein BC940DRAFT_98671 [Gongronella butleri]